jgi:hypothetical protein
MTKRSYQPQQAIADFLTISRRHFGLPPERTRRKQPTTARRLTSRLACLLLAGSFSAMAGTALADEDGDGVPDAPQMRMARDAKPSQP